jgi:hypothetical protein
MPEHPMSSPVPVSEVPEQVLDELARDLAALHRQHTLRFALDVGKMVLDRLYGGSLDAWRAGAGASDGSLRKLAAKLTALGARGFSAASLQSAVAVLDVDERVAVSSRPQLNASHVRAVLGLPPAKQEELLGKAEGRNWTAKQLEKEAAKAKKRLTTRTGRPPLPAFVKTVNRWERELADDAATFADLEQAAALDPGEARRIRAAVHAMRERCDRLLAELPE